MSIKVWIRLTMFLVVLLGTRSFAQQPSQVRSPGETGGRLPLLFREEWKQPPYTGELTDEKRRITRTQDALSNPDLELTLYGPDAKDLLVAEHEGRHDLWTGLVLSPVAATLRDKDFFIDLRGGARLRWITRTQSLHVIHPVVKLADGTLLAGNASESTDGDFLESEVAFNNQRWYKLDPQQTVTTIEVKNPDLSRVDEIGFVDLMPSGGKGFAGWSNLSIVELYAKTVPRDSATR